MTQLNLVIVDANQLDRSAMATFLGSLGHNTTIIIDEDKALDFIVKNRPPIVFVNDKLINGNAQEFIVKASQRKVFNHTAFVFMSDIELNDSNKAILMTLGYCYFVLNNSTQKNLDLIQKCIVEELNVMNMLKYA